eukprot:307444-Prorocentrum_minimum.AAC.1
MSPAQTLGVWETELTCIAGPTHRDRGETELTCIAGPTRRTQCPVRRASPAESPVRGRRGGTFFSSMRG